MEKENVITKIQKLLKLQYGAEQIGSTGEAYQAAKLVVECLTVKFKPTKEDLRELRDKGLETDVMMVLVSEFIKQGKSKEEIVVFFEKVGAIGAAPSFSFEGGNIIYWCK